MNKEYEKCSICGGEVIDDKPHYIPIGTDSVLRIVDQKCSVCNCAIIGPHQQTKLIQNQEAHDKLVSAMEARFRESNKGG